jgi:hypothetical protein
MGTSSSNPGPKGNRSLLPPWANEPMPPVGIPEPLSNDAKSPNPTPEIAPESEPPKKIKPKDPIAPIIPAVSWRSPKQAMQGYRNERSKESFEKVGRSYVKASGGSKVIAKSARAGRSSTSAVASFFSSVAQFGLNQTAKDFGFPQLSGKNIELVLATFVDALAPTGASLEEAAARKAVIETLSDVFEKFDVENVGITALENLNSDDIKKIIQISIENYVNERLQLELINRIEAGSKTISEANQISDEIEGYIHADLKLNLTDIDPLNYEWESAEGKDFVESLYKRAYSILGDEK